MADLLFVNSQSTIPDASGGPALDVYNRQLANMIVSNSLANMAITGASARKDNRTGIEQFNYLLAAGGTSVDNETTLNADTNGVGVYKYLKNGDVYPVEGTSYINASPKGTSVAYQLNTLSTYRTPSVQLDRDGIIGVFVTRLTTSNAASYLHPNNVVDNTQVAAVINPDTWKGGKFYPATTMRNVYSLNGPNIVLTDKEAPYGYVSEVLDTNKVDSDSEAVGIAVGRETVTIEDAKGHYTFLQKFDTSTAKDLPLAHRGIQRSYQFAVVGPKRSDEVMLRFKPVGNFDPTVKGVYFIEMVRLDAIRNLETWMPSDDDFGLMLCGSACTGKNSTTFNSLWTVLALNGRPPSGPTLITDGITNPAVKTGEIATAISEAMSGELPTWSNEGRIIADAVGLAVTAAANFIPGGATVVQAYNYASGAISGATATVLEGINCAIRYSDEKSATDVTYWWDRAMVAIKNTASRASARLSTLYATTPNTPATQSTYRCVD